MQTDIIFSVKCLVKTFKSKRKAIDLKVTNDHKAVDDVSFDIIRGTSTGLVGGSGSGKTTLARCLLLATKPTSGEIFFHPTLNTKINLLNLNPIELRSLRKNFQMIFQDPYSSLNPHMTVRQIIAEPLLVHDIYKGIDLHEKVNEMITAVGLDAGHLDRFPGALSGGQRQRVGIARAVIMKPSFIICDEATSALDSTTQTQILDLLKHLQSKFNLTILFITHNLDIMRNYCDNIMVMRNGKIIESGDTHGIFNMPLHPYTKLLLKSGLSINPDLSVNITAEQNLLDLHDNSIPS